jgi:hypothetical protein
MLKKVFESMLFIRMWKRLRLPVWEKKPRSGEKIAKAQDFRVRVLSGSSCPNQEKSTSK